MKLMAHYRATRMLDDNDGALFEAACNAMTGSIAPYIATCYMRVYPGQGKLINVRKAVAALSSTPEGGDAGAAGQKLRDRTGSTASSSTQVVPSAGGQAKPQTEQRGNKQKTVSMTSEA